MTPATKTLAAINAHIEGVQESSHRAHLGASVIGKPCARELWYDWRWTLAERFSGQQLRLFERGNLEEPRFIGYLKAIGVEVWPNNPDAPLKDGKPQQWRAGPWHDGHFGGSPDGFGRGLPDLPPGVPFAISCKTHNEKSFGKLKEMGVMGCKFEHFIQEQVYLHHFREAWRMPLEWCLYMATCKNDDHLHLELLHYSEQIAKNAIERGGNIIYANEPPQRIANSPGHFNCKFCHFNRLCHFGDVTPDRNCRTCRYGRPGGNAQWVCGLRQINLDDKAQREACGSYQTHAKLTGVQP